jgi:hypothetical protein
MCANESVSLISKDFFSLYSAILEISLFLRITLRFPIGPDEALMWRSPGHGFKKPIAPSVQPGHLR